MFKVLGWLLFVGGIICVLWVLLQPIVHLLDTIASLLDLLLTAKFWGLVGAVILIWGGWKLAHKGG